MAASATDTYSIPANSAPPTAGLATALQTSSVGDVSNALNSPMPGYVAIASSSNLQADFNRDGKEDIVWRNYTNGQNVVWLMNGSSILSSVYLQSVSDLNWRMEGVGDFTGDRKPDILWRNYATGQNVIWRMNGISLVSSINLPAVNDLNWRIAGVGNFSNSQADLLWRNYATGQNVIWKMNGTTLASSVSLPTMVGTNITIQPIASVDDNSTSDIIWRNYLTGENGIWLMNSSSVASTIALPTVNDPNWQIKGQGHYLPDDDVNILWRNAATGKNVLWSLNDASVTSSSYLNDVPDLNWQIGLNDSLPPATLTTAGFSFSGQEGDRGTFQIRLNRAPSSNVALTLTGGNYLVVDADGNIQNGDQNTITFTPANWNQLRTVSFIAEKDNTSADRTTGNTISYSLSGGLSGSGVYDLGRVNNTYAPDPNRFNIDLDFRNDYLGFWTPARQAIAQQAADDWAQAIASRWAGFQLPNATIGRLDSSGNRLYSFNTKRYVDDLLIFVNLFQGGAGSVEPALGGPEYDFGGWANSPATYGLMPRVGQIAISPTVFANQPDRVLYQVVSHEIGHTLGLLGLNWIGFQQLNLTNLQTATFRGAYATATYGAPIPLQSQDGGDIAHPAARVQSIMSYGWIYTLPGPTQIDFAMLADSGYRVYGFNA